MLTIKQYVRAQSLEEAYEKNQARSSRVMGGMMWMRQSNARIHTLIDLADLGLDTIEENDHIIKIGAMCTLRMMEGHEGLARMCGNTFKESVRHIVGVQFRNQATIGGSIYGRYGFSDVLTWLLVLDSYVELYQGGTIPLVEFVKQKPNSDILVSIIIKKRKRRVRYESIRQSATDFPILTCAVVYGISAGTETWYFSIGARPMRAELLKKEWDAAKMKSEQEVAMYAKEVARSFSYGSNMRGSADYRAHLAEVLIRRAMWSIVMEENKI